MSASMQHFRGKHSNTIPLEVKRRMTLDAVRVIGELRKERDRLGRVIGILDGGEQDLIDQLFNSTGKRLARTLLLLASYGKKDQSERVVPQASQEVLADMIVTTRSRVDLFMNKFEIRVIHYNGGLQVHTSLLSVVLHE
jgi:hypothetical protein